MARIDMPEGANVLVPGEYSLIEAALSNKGNPTSQAFNNLMLVEQSQPVRIVDKSGKVIFEGIGPEAARQAVAIGQDLTDTQGKKAGWNIQTVPVGTNSFKTIANEKVDTNVLGTVADLALPIAGTLLAGPLGLGALGLGAAGTAAAGAAIGSGISSAAQGRSLEDSLLRAAIAGGGSYLGGQLLAPGASASAPMTGINADLIPNALEGLSFGSLTGASIPAGVGGAAGDIIVNAARTAASNLAGSAAGGVLGQAAASQIATPNQGNVDSGTDLNDGYVDPETGDIVVSKYRPINPPGGFDPIALLQGPGLGSALSGVPALTELAMDPTLTGPAEEDIVVTGNRPVPQTAVPDVLAAIGPLLPQLGIPQVPAPDPALTQKDGILGTGLNLPQLISIGGVGADLLGSLLGGSGAGTGAPYVSPFGTGVGFAQGQDMRVNPNIADYERYGFGPEAMFFRPEYSGLASAGAAAPQAQPAMTINPVYQPLI